MTYIGPYQPQIYRAGLPIFDVAGIVTSGLVARYACDDATSGSGVTTVTDSVGGFNLTATGHTWTSTGISFTGAGATSYARNTSFNPSISAAYTFQIVVNQATPDSGATLHYTIGLVNSGTLRPSAWLGGSYGGDAASATKAIALYDGGTLVSSAAAQTYNNANDGGVWRSVAWAYDNAGSPKTNIYKDVTLQSVFSANITGTVAAFNTLIIGARGDLNNTNALVGTIAYVLVYDRALTSVEVTQNHNALKSIVAPRGITLA